MEGSRSGVASSSRQSDQDIHVQTGSHNTNALGGPHERGVLCSVI